MLFSTILLSVSLLPLLTSGAPIRARHGDGDDHDAPTVPSNPTNNEDPKVIQGLNFLFSSFSAETSCNKGQVACVKGGTATCAEDNDVFELTPCANGLTCFASPGLINGSIPIGCTTEAAVNQALTTLGVTDGVSKDNGVTTLPANIIIVSTGNDGSFPTETATDSLPTATATATSTETAAPEPTCVPDEDGDDDDDEGELPSTVPTFEATLGDPVPTGTVVASTTSDLPVDPTCTEEPEDPEATETGTVGGTETIPTETASVSTLTLILVPNPTAPGEFITSTFSPSTSTSTVTVTASTGTVVSIETSSIPSTSTVIPGPTITPSGPLVNPIGTGQIPAVPDVNTIGVGEIPVKRAVAKRQQAPIGSPAGSAGPDASSSEVISAQDAQGRNSFVYIVRPESLTTGVACGNEGGVQCIDNGTNVARCRDTGDGLKWTVEQSCGDGTQCYWVPSTDGTIAPAVTCTTYVNAAATFGALSLGLFAPGF